MKLDIEKVNLSDSGIVLSILRENAEWMLSQGIEQWPIEWLESIKDEIINSIKDQNYYFALYDQKIIGVFEVLRTPEKIWNNDDSPSIYLHKLAIKREMRGLGVGAKILVVISNWAAEEGRDYVRLDCVSSNSKLRRYYEGKGFSFRNTIYNGKVDVALYEKRINV